MHKKRKNLHKVKKSTQPSDNSVSLNIKDNMKKSRPSTRKKNARGKEDEIVFVGIHSRRGDHLHYQKENNIQVISEDYFLDAMDMYREKFKEVVFVYVSDDLKWGKQK